MPGSDDSRGGPPRLSRQERKVFSELELEMLLAGDSRAFMRRTGVAKSTALRYRYLVRHGAFYGVTVKRPPGAGGA